MCDKRAECSRSGSPEMELSPGSSSSTVPPPGGGGGGVAVAGGGISVVGGSGGGGSGAVGGGSVVTRPPITALFREIHKNSWLRRLNNDSRRPSVLAKVCSPPVTTRRLKERDKISVTNVLRRLGPFGNVGGGQSGSWWH